MGRDDVESWILEGFRGDLLAAAAAVAAVAFVAGRATARRRGRPAAPDDPATEGLRAELASLRSAQARAVAERRDLDALMATISQLVRHLNTRRTRREIVPVLADAAARVFDPRGVGVFVTAQDGASLVLAAARGLFEAVPREVEIRFGEGRIGRVAQSGLTATEADFASEPRYVSETPGGLGRLETAVTLCAPMIHGDVVLGTLALARPRKTYENARPLLRMLADLGASALHHALRLNDLQAAARTDPLTGLSNRRHLLEQAIALFEHARSTREPVGAIAIDIDHFKQYNDRNGHPAGDEALRIVARLLRTSLRDGDVAARAGGEEFIALLPAADRDAAYEVAEKIRLAIAACDFPHGDGQPMGRVTISGGVAAFPDDGADSRSVLAAADAALYEAKRAGRNRIAKAAAESLAAARDESADSGPAEGVPWSW